MKAANNHRRKRNSLPQVAQMLLTAGAVTSKVCWSAHEIAAPALRHYAQATVQWIRVVRNKQQAQTLHAAGAVTSKVC